MSLLDLDLEALDPTKLAPLLRPGITPYWLHIVESANTPWLDLCKAFVTGEVPGQLLLYCLPETKLDLDMSLSAAWNGHSIPESILTFSSLGSEFLSGLLMSAWGVVAFTPDSPYLWQALALDKQGLVLQPSELPEEIVWSFDWYHLANTLTQSYEAPKTGMREYVQQTMAAQIEHRWEQSQQWAEQKRYQAAVEWLKPIFHKRYFLREEFETVARWFERAGESDPSWLAELDAARQMYLLQAQQTVFMPIGDPQRSLPIAHEAFHRSFEYINAVGLGGDVVEFGTFRGFSAKIMATLMREFGITGHFSTFDSFQGFPPISAIADQGSYEVSQRKTWVPGAFSTHPAMVDLIQDGLQAILPASQVTVIPGFFQDTLPHHLPQAPVSLVHLDCDLYESTRYVLNTLITHDLLQDGTVLMFDDYNCNRANPRMGQRRALREVFAAQDRFEYSLFFTYAWSGQAFFVHDNQCGPNEGC